jgi:hypothetical protein
MAVLPEPLRELLDDEARALLSAGPRPIDHGDPSAEPLRMVAWALWFACTGDGTASRAERLLAAGIFEGLTGASGTEADGAWFPSFLEAWNEDPQQVAPRIAAGIGAPSLRRALVAASVLVASVDELDDDEVAAARFLGDALGVGEAEGAGVASRCIDWARAKAGDDATAPDVGPPPAWFGRVCDEDEARAIMTRGPAAWARAVASGGSEARSADDERAMVVVKALACLGAAAIAPGRRPSDEERARVVKRLRTLTGGALPAGIADHLAQSVPPPRTRDAAVRLLEEHGTAALRRVAFVLAYACASDGRTAAPLAAVASLDADLGIAPREGSALMRAFTTAPRPLVFPLERLEGDGAIEPPPTPDLFALVAADPSARAAIEAALPALTRAYGPRPKGGADDRDAAAKKADERAAAPLAEMIRAVLAAGRRGAELDETTVHAVAFGFFLLSGGGVLPAHVKTVARRLPRARPVAFDGLAALLSSVALRHATHALAELAAARSGAPDVGLLLRLRAALEIADDNGSLAAASARRFAGCDDLLRKAAFELAAAGVAGRVEALAPRVDPGLRGGALTESRQLVVIPEGAASSVTFSPRGTSAAFVLRPPAAGGAKSAKRLASVVCDGRRGVPFDEIVFLRFSPDGGRLAYVGEDKARDERLLVEGDRVIGPYRSITLAGVADDGALAFTAKQRDRRSVAWIGDVRSAPFDEWIPHLLVSPDLSRHFLIGVDAKLANHVVRDGVRSPATWVAISGLVATPDLERVAFLGTTARSGPRHTRLVVDGEPIGDPADEARSLALSRDGAVVAFDAKVDGRVRVVCNGLAFDDAFDEVFHIALSPRGDHLAFSAKRGGEVLVVVDGDARAVPVNRWVRSVVVASNGRVAYVATHWTGSEDVDVVFVDGQEIDRTPSASRLAFSGDGSRFAYVARRVFEEDGRRRQRDRVVLDGVAGPELAAIETPLRFAGDGRSLVYGGFVGREVRWFHAR